MKEKPNEFELNTLDALIKGEADLGLYATEYRLFECKNYQTTIGGRMIYLKQRVNALRKDIFWVVWMDGYCLGKDGRFHYEATPSNRTMDFVLNTRFKDKIEALERLKEHLVSLDGKQGNL